MGRLCVYLGLTLTQNSSTESGILFFRLSFANSNKIPRLILNEFPVRDQETHLRRCPHQRIPQEFGDIFKKPPQPDRDQGIMLKILSGKWWVSLLFSFSQRAREN